MFSYLHHFEVIPVELPGRGRRIDEELITDFDAAALDLYAQITRKLSSDTFYLYGHSLGAYLALRVANLLEKAGQCPSYVFVSGNAGPGVNGRGKGNWHLLEREDFIQALRGLGGIPEEFTANKELLDMYLPVLRADFRIVEKKELDDEPPVNAPLLAMMGDQEETAGKITNWARFTQSHFDYKILPGNHFFIRNHPHTIARIMEDCCNLAGVAQS